ncbi:MAG: hypothetical protein ABFE08_05135 [Armatimonadia bacterium]
MIARTDEAKREPAVSRREMTWVLVWAVFVMLLTCIPYIHAMKIADGRTFSGFLWGVDEGNVYLTWMRQASEGEIFFRNQYAAVPENPRFVNLFLQLGGRLAGLLNIDLRIMWHVLRLLGGGFLLIAFYLLTAELTRDRVARWAALALASLGSGFGWLVAVNWPQSGLHPVDVGVSWQVQPEAVTFPSLLLNGLFTTSMALMCLTFLYALRALRDNDRRATVYAGLCLLVLGNIHTYDVFPVWLALIAWVVAGGIGNGESGIGRGLKRLLPVFLVGLPTVLYALYATFSDPAFLAKGLTPTPAFRFLDYAVAYGLPGLLALGGAILVFTRFPIPNSRFPMLWGLSNALVLLIPVSFQRKMIEGLHLPLCILAGFAVSWLATTITRGLRDRGKHKQAMERVVLTVCAVVVFSIPSNALFVSQALHSAKTNNSELLAVLQPPIYLEPEDAQAMQWLATNTQKTDVILSSSFMGSYIPTYCPAKVWVGHWAETLNFGDRLAEANAVFDAPDPREPLVQKQLPVSLIYYGPWERALTGAAGVDPAAWAAAARLAYKPIYDTGRVTIYRLPETRP